MHRRLDHDKLLALYLEHGDSWSYTQYGQELRVPPVPRTTVAAMIFRFRQQGLLPPNDKADYLASQLVRNTGITPANPMHIYLLRLREVDQIRRGKEPKNGQAGQLREGEGRRAREFARGLLRDRRVVDLDAEGVPFLRPSRTEEWEVRSLISLPALPGQEWALGQIRQLAAEDRRQRERLAAIVAVTDGRRVG